MQHWVSVCSYLDPAKCCVLYKVLDECTFMARSGLMAATLFTGLGSQGARVWPLMHCRQQVPHLFVVHLGASSQACTARSHELAALASAGALLNK